MGRFPQSQRPSAESRRDAHFFRVEAVLDALRRSPRPMTTPQLHKFAMQRTNPTHSERTTRRILAHLERMAIATKLGGEWSPQFPAADAYPAETDK